MQDNTNYDQVFFEQYKILVGSYESLINKRTSVNNFFVIIYSSIIGLYNFINSTEVSTVKSAFSIYSLAIFVSINWAMIILKFLRAEKEKYVMVEKMEQDMPVKIFSAQQPNNYLFNSKIASTTVFELMLPIGLLVLFSLDLWFNYMRA